MWASLPRRASSVLRECDRVLCLVRYVDGVGVRGPGRERGVRSRVNLGQTKRAAGDADGRRTEATPTRVTLSRDPEMNRGPPWPISPCADDARRVAPSVASWRVC